MDGKLARRREGTVVGYIINISYHSLGGADKYRERNEVTISGFSVEFQTRQRS
jgi:hypothetical protein